MANEHNELCTVAQRIHDYRAVRSDKGLRGLFETVDLDERDLGHLAIHAKEFVDDVEPLNFAWGILFGLLLARERTPAEISDDELAELLAE